MSSSKSDRPGRSRRNFLALAGVTSAAVLAGVRPTSSFAQGGAAPPHLSESDPTAKALGFVTDASKVSAASNPTYKAGSKCSTCAQYTGKPSDASGPCNIFAGHTVPSGGWCSVWAAKPA